MQKFIIKITSEDMSLLKTDALECFILSDNLSDGFAEQFAAAARKQGRLVLAESSAACVRHQLDGVILDLSKSENIRKDFEQETATLKNKFSGVICRNRRHEAMLASECEPDFLVFRAWADGQEKVRELTAWYSEMFLIQSALLPMEENLDFETFQTDFVILDDTKYKIFVAKK